jgi:DNA-binding NtrC family response regulator
MSIERILLLEDDEIVRTEVEHQLQARGYAVTSAACLAEARDHLVRNPFDLIITDVRVPDGSGVELLEQRDAQNLRPLVIVISAFGSPESAVDAMRQGAFAFLLKPFSSDQLAVNLQRAEEHARLIQVSQYLSRGEDSELLGPSGAMEQLRKVIRTAARSLATVLIRGEHGAGKELVARALYRQSPRADRPLIKVDCAAISPQQCESELFGRSGGALPGAAPGQPGCLELAHDGTLLLDEIGEFPLGIQERLLRFLQERELTRVGSERRIKVDVRLIATSSRPLEEWVRVGKLREDFFLALNLVPVTVAPLRARKEDIPVLAERLRGRFARQHGVDVMALSAASLAALQAHTWPGNVRELQQVIEQAVLRCREGGLIEPKHLSSALAVPSGALVLETDKAAGAGVPKVDTLAEVEKAHIFAALDQFHGNRTHAAAALSISIRTLRYKLRQYREEAAAQSAGTKAVTG